MIRSYNMMWLKLNWHSDGILGAEKSQDLQDSSSLIAWIEYISWNDLVFVTLFCVLFDFSWFKWTNRNLKTSFRAYIKPICGYSADLLQNHLQSTVTRRLSQRLHLHSSMAAAEDTRRDETRCRRFFTDNDVSWKRHDARYVTTPVCIRRYSPAMTPDF